MDRCDFTSELNPIYAWRSTKKKIIFVVMNDTHEKPDKGKILISAPYLNDIFKRSVILLTENDENGTVGFIINKPLRLKIHDVVEDFPNFDATVHLGGPVQPDMLNFIHKAGDVIDGGYEISNGIYWGGNFETFKILAEAGLSLIVIGFESGSDRILKFLRKGCTRAQNIEAARICHALKIKIWANYMLGIPTETNEDVQLTYTMLEEIMPYHCSPALYTPHPGSDLYNWGQSKGIHLITKHDSYRRNYLSPKIKGPDYDFLIKIFYRSFALGQDMNEPVPMVHQKGQLGFFKSFWSSWRNVIRGKIMRVSPQFYHLLKSMHQN